MIAFEALVALAKRAQAMPKIAPACIQQGAG
jgi:hypothetical protein